MSASEARSEPKASGGGGAGYAGAVPAMPARLPRVKEHPRVVIVDGTNSLYRAFFAIPKLRAADGTPTNAAYGFVTMLGKVIREETPDYLLVVFDARGENFRHQLYADYKATRDAQPEDLSAQIPIVRELVQALQIPILEVAGFEADDVIATLVHRAPPDARIAIVSSDKDLMQLVGERVVLLDGMKDRRYDEKEVENRFGVPPSQLLDLRALTGDTSDNIPGVSGIGAKGAAELIRRWGDLENLLAHAGEVESKRAREALLEQADRARLSKRLAALRSNVPLAQDLEMAERREPDLPRLRSLFERLGFTRLLEGLARESRPEPAGESAVAVRRIESLLELDALVAELRRLPEIALFAVFGDAQPMDAGPAGLAFALGPERAAYLPLAGDTLLASGLAPAEAIARLRGLFEGAGALPWSARETKRLQVWLAEQGLEVPAPAFDAELAVALLDPSGSRTLESLASQELGTGLRSWHDLAGRGAKARPASEIPPEQLAAWAGAQASAASRLTEPLARELTETGMHALYDSAELPLTRVLARMERAGVRIDEAALARLSRDFSTQLAQLEEQIYTLAGERFLISSPKQLQQILFEKLKLGAIRKTKTGYSTDEDVLAQLASQHDLPLQILAHRRLSKLKNTYVDALPPLVNPRTGRIHPTFHQLGAATGRVSATQPNVQNIPIRSPDGVRIREAFVPAEGCRLLSADYSQVELRILAHYSGDESLIDAFRRGEDVHRRTAAGVAGIPPDAVSGEQRARAKAINFGIIYGSSAFGIANQLGIATGEAQATIDAYFARYQGVRRFLDQTIAEARREGFVRTLLGRRRYLPDLASRNRALKNAAERMAVNSVIQGSAADLIKKAMVEVDAELEAAGLRSRMILQVHDELVFEVPEGEVEELRRRIPERMQAVLPLRVPLVVDIGVGSNWREAH
jgi:DNA polymerase I